jgi:hypothetical protein
VLSRYHRDALIHCFHFQRALVHRVLHCLQHHSNKMPSFHNTSFRSIAAIAAFLFDAFIPLVVVASTIDQHHAPQSVKMEQLLLAVASLFVLSCGRDYLEQRFEKVLCSLEDVVDSTQ